MDDVDDAPASHTPSPSNSSPSASPSPSHSLSPSPCHPPLPITVVHPSDSPQPNGNASDNVTVASAAPHHQILTLALPIQHPPPSASAIGGGREDCWSEGATSSLIDAWGERFLDLNRGSLKQKQWQEVAEVVSSRDDYTKAPRTEAQCKNRIDTLKKKYKLEKAKITAGGPSASSSWPFFHRLDALLGPVTKPSPLPAVAPTKQPPPAAVAAAARSHFPQKQRTHLPSKRKASLPPAAASPPSSSDSFPPEAPAPLANGRQKGAPAAGMKELARAILNFGEVYQRVENSKLQQAMELERQRMGFASELEMQRIQFFMKTQMELFRLKLRRPSTGPSGGGGTGNNHHLQSRRRHHPQPPRNKIGCTNENSE
ncbi:hypothetical protein HPP92_013026 [Vanilla planifolia]|uniref:Myb/SANT-like DNA-binding domain-containing protein n=1 Tax=Vanilla planifolia TaxID=51239 RepID=A0A835UXL5_VANPL|nr:hypothetical protein HPP92_013026 [Vanilla planifolia]